MADAARKEVFDLVYRHAKASGLPLAGPPQGAAQPHPGLPTHLERETPLGLLAAVPLFASMTDEEREAMAETMRRREYRKGNLLVAQGTVLKPLMIIRSGAVWMTRSEGTMELELFRPAPGDYLGEREMLTGEGEVGTLQALAFTVVFEFEQGPLRQILEDRPGIIDEISAVLARRDDRERVVFSTATPKADANAVPWLANAQIARRRRRAAQAGCLQNFNIAGNAIGGISV